MLVLHAIQDEKKLLYSSVGAVSWTVDTCIIKSHNHNIGMLASFIPNAFLYGLGGKAYEEKWSVSLDVNTGTGRDSNS